MADRHREPVDPRRLGQWAYLALALGLVFYIITMWAQVYIDTKTLPAGQGVFGESHRRWRLRTALIFLIWSVLGGFTLPFGIGWFVVIPAYVWYLWRVARGAAAYWAGKPVGVPRQRPVARLADPPQ
ncbi:MAG TPA: hypothetical protein VF265_06985 [Nevskiaceae bacterium]